MLLCGKLVLLLLLHSDVHLLSLDLPTHAALPLQCRTASRRSYLWARPLRRRRARRCLVSWEGWPQLGNLSCMIRQLLLAGQDALLLLYVLRHRCQLHAIPLGKPAFCPPLPAHLATHTLPPSNPHPPPPGVPSLEALDPARPLLLPELDSPLSGAARALLDEVRRQRSAYLRLRVVRRGDPIESTFYSALIEDRTPAGGMSYVEYLCFLHRQIQNKMS